MWVGEASIDVTPGIGRLWALFTDVEGWTRWNAGIERIELRGPFADETQFLMQPPGIKPFTSQLRNVRPAKASRT